MLETVGLLPVGACYRSYCHAHILYNSYYTGQHVLARHPQLGTEGFYWSSFTARLP